MFEIYKYALENPKSSISEAVFRMRRICTRADAIMITDERNNIQKNNSSWKFRRY